MGDNQLERLARDRRLFKRFRAEIEADVKVESIGSHRPYNSITGNISSGGIFVKASDKLNFPFSLQSILEISLVLDEKDTIRFVGKVAHLNKNRGFGVKIIQISDQDQRVLDQHLQRYAEEHPEVKPR